MFNAGERFEVRRQLGAGGMGVVYEAFDRELQMLVALKALRNDDGAWLARFKQEFRSLHDLAHRNLVTLGEFFDGPTAPFFSLELVRGVDFLSYVRQSDGSGAPPSGSDAESASGPPTSDWRHGLAHGATRPGSRSTRGADRWRRR